MQKGSLKNIPAEFGENVRRQKREFKIELETLPDLDYKQALALAPLTETRTALNKQLKEIDAKRMTAKAKDLHKLRIEEKAIREQLATLKAQISAKRELLGISAEMSDWRQVVKSHRYQRLLFVKEFDFDVDTPITPEEVTEVGEYEEYLKKQNLIRKMMKINL